VGFWNLRSVRDFEGRSGEFFFFFFFNIYAREEGESLFNRLDASILIIVFCHISYFYSFQFSQCNFSLL
jgi:hypothetical protein